MQQNILLTLCLENRECTDISLSLQKTYKVLLILTEITHKIYPKKLYKDHLNFTHRYKNTLQQVKSTSLLSFKNGQHILQNGPVDTAMGLCLPLYMLEVCQQVSNSDILRLFCFACELK